MSSNDNSREQCPETMYQDMFQDLLRAADVPEPFHGLLLKAFAAGVGAHIECRIKTAQALEECDEDTARDLVRGFVDSYYALLDQAIEAPPVEFKEVSGPESLHGGETVH